jgi:ArsR family transcriptional regulator
MPARKNEATLELLLRALGDRTRLRLLNLMGNDEVCVCLFVEVLGTNQPKISRHLAYLRRAGIVDARREGKWMHYRIVRPRNERAHRVLDEVLASLTDDAEMNRDRKRLDRLCCGPRSLIQLKGAPLPERLTTSLSA